MYRITVTYHDNHSSACLVQAESEREALNSIDPFMRMYKLVAVSIERIG
jgi:hypothetical protein